MRINIIGIGLGAPAHLTGAAVEAMRQVDVFLVADKRQATAELVRLREQVCEAVLAPGSYRFITVPDPQRGPDAARDAAQYREGVRDWHAARVDSYAGIIAELPHDVCVGFLVWGDPAFYDSTIRIIDGLGDRLPARAQVRVVPGLSALQVLAAEHRIVLNSVGGAVHLTTGRRLRCGYDPAWGTVVVMLDASLTALGWADRFPDVQMVWGAYLGLPQQVLRRGRLAELAAELPDLRAGLRAEHGWVMDTYALLGQD